METNETNWKKALTVSTDSTPPTTTTINLVGKGLSSTDIKDLVDHVTAREEVHRAVTALTLSNNPFGDVGVHHLCDFVPLCPSLTSLVLRDVSAGLSGASYLGSLLERETGLLHLDLAGNAIGDTGLLSLAAAISKNPGSRLTELSLSNVGGGLRGAEAIASIIAANASLKKLDVSKNAFKDTGTKKISIALSQNKTLTSFNLSDNNFGSSGALALAEALSEHPSLNALNISNNPIGEAGLSSLLGSLSRNNALRTLNVSNAKLGNRSATSIGQWIASQVSALEEIDLSNNDILSTGSCEIVRGLATNARILSLNLGFNQLNVDGAKAIKDLLVENTVLSILILRQTGISDVGASHIALGLGDNTALSRLDLTNNQIRNSGGSALATALETNATLRELVLKNNELGETASREFIRVLGENNAKVRVLLEGNPSIGPSSQKELTELLKDRTLS